MAFTTLRLVSSSNMLRLILLLHYTTSARPVTAVDSLMESSEDMSQWSLGDFQITLSPTPEPLTDVDDILGPAIEKVVRLEMERLYAESFEYMYVAGLKEINFDGPSNRRQLQPPSTSVVYNGGVVAFDGEPSSNVSLLVQSSIEAYLVDVLVANSGPWASIKKVTFIDLEPPTSAPVPMAGFAGVQEQEEMNSNSILQEGEGRAPRQLIGGLAGVALLIAGLALLVRHAKRREHNEDLSSALDHAETSSQNSSNDRNKDKLHRSLRELEQAANGSKVNYYHSESGDPYVFENNEDDEDRSEMAQYGANSSQVSEGTSVASSEWTMAASDEGTLGGSTIGYLSSYSSQPCHAGSRAAAMAYASSETFERDRLVTLQKDMLQSEWAHVPSHQPKQQHSGTPTASLTPPSRPIMTKTSTMSFQQAHGDEEDGQGEEVYLMPIARRSRSDSEESTDENNGLV